MNGAGGHQAGRSHCVDWIQLELVLLDGGIRRSNPGNCCFVVGVPVFGAISGVKEETPVEPCTGDMVESSPPVG